MQQDFTSTPAPSLSEESIREMPWPDDYIWIEEGSRVNRANRRGEQRSTRRYLNGQMIVHLLALKNYYKLTDTENHLIITDLLDHMEIYTHEIDEGLAVSSCWCINITTFGEYTHMVITYHIPTDFSHPMTNIALQENNSLSRVLTGSSPINGIKSPRFPKQNDSNWPLSDSEYFVPVDIPI